MHFSRETCDCYASSLCKICVLIDIVCLAVQLARPMNKEKGQVRKIQKRSINCLLYCGRETK